MQRKRNLIRGVMSAQLRQRRRPRTSNNELTPPAASPPWSVEEQPACFVVRDHDGQQLAYVYFEEEPGLAIGRQAAHPRRGAADCGQYRQAAGAVAQALVTPLRLISCRAF